MPAAIAGQSAASRCSQAEWEARVELAALYRVLNHFGMTDIANQEVGARVPDQPDHFLIHPYGYLYEEIRASDLVKVRLDGTVTEGNGVWAGAGKARPGETGARFVSDGGVNLGRWFFGARPDVNFFVHGHCEDVMAVSATEAGLKPVSQAAVYLLHHLCYIDYDFAEDDEYAEKLIRTLGDRHIVVSHNHGYYALGASASAAFFRAYYLRQACSVQVRAASMGGPLHTIDMQRVAMLQDQMDASDNYAYDGSTEWAALLRKLERECPDYRT